MPVSLEILNLYDGGKFTGGIPAEWSSMTKLKELDMRHCSLNGESCVFPAPTQREQEPRESE